MSKMNLKNNNVKNLNGESMMEQTNVENVNYDSGSWYIDDNSELIIEQDAYIVLTDDIWVELDVDGDFCKVMTDAGEVTDADAVHIWDVGKAEQILTEYEDVINFSEIKILEEYADGYREYLKNKSIDGEIEVVDKEYLRAHNYSHIQCMAEPIARWYIIKLV